MSESLDETAAIEGEEAEQSAPRRRGRPPKNAAEIAAQADNAVAIAEAGFNPGPMALIVVSVKPSEGWRCPYVDDGHGGTRITEPREKMWVPLSLARFMEKNEQAIILERKERDV